MIYFSHRYYNGAAIFRVCWEYRSKYMKDRFFITPLYTRFRII